MMMLLMMMIMMLIMMLMLMMVMMMMMVIMTIVSVEQRPGWGEHVKTSAVCSHMSCVLDVLHGGTKQGKAYAAGYALLTRAQVLLTHVIVPYADLTRTIFSTSPQFRLTRSNFYMQESKQ